MAKLVKPVMGYIYTKHRRVRLDRLANKLSEFLRRGESGTLTLTGVIQTENGEIHSYSITHGTMFSKLKHFAVRRDGKVQFPYYPTWRGNNALEDLFYDELYYKETK